MLETSLSFVKKVGPKRAEMLAKAGLTTVADVFYCFPRAYQDVTKNLNLNELNEGQYASVKVEIVRLEERRTHGGKKQLNIHFTDGRTFLLGTWFKYGSWLPEKYKVGDNVQVSGQISYFMGSLQMVHPDMELVGEEKRGGFWQKRPLLPVYPLTATLTMSQMRDLVYTVFYFFHREITEILPFSICRKHNFENRHTAIQRVHFPVTIAQASAAKKRFIYEEFFFHQLLMLRCHRLHQKQEKFCRLQPKNSFTSQLRQSLPFQLTAAQLRVLNEISQDLLSGYRMNRLLQGDVGSGKTVVTLFCMLLSCENDLQTILMAPTEILAEQHYHNFCLLLKDLPAVKIALLKGGPNTKVKNSLKEEIAAGKIHIIIGTHALIQKDVAFKKVGLAVIDEQHRFGVEQRTLLTKKCGNTDLLCLSATPIPRSLAMTLYGDLDISILDELPPGRKPVATYWCKENEKASVYNLLGQFLKEGRQVYIVCPLVEDSEKTDLLAVYTLYEKITAIFPQHRSAVIHGKMKNREKETVMHEFKDNQIKILIATTVIEVGIDVPNASVMIIEQAERFGLSQLHQLRGRVGRGKTKSYCYLISYHPISDIGKERLRTMTKTSDGFLIAEKDLELRGPGDFFGTQQTGLPLFRFADLTKDQELLTKAREDAQNLLLADPNLNNPENNPTKLHYELYFKNKEKFYLY